MTNTHDQRLRTRIAQEAARILLNEGVRDYQLAKRKAAQRLNVGDRSLPRNCEVEQAVLDHQRLFFTAGYDGILSALRHAAFEAMSLLHRFQPRLVGSVLKGTVSSHSDINLHVFADAVEDVIFVLMDAGIAYKSAERRLRYADEVQYYPALRFAAQKHEVNALILSPAALKQLPLSPIDGKPMQRANLKQVQRLLAAESGRDGQAEIERD